jgi:tetratricopeptide (TPR) repeat protein
MPAKSTRKKRRQQAAEQKPDRAEDTRFLSRRTLSNGPESKIENLKSKIALTLPALIGIATFVAFLPTLQNGFVNWDDEVYLLDNVNYRGLGLKQLRWIFDGCYMGSCMPLNWVTYGFDYVIWGLNPFGYHLTSMTFHAVNAMLFYFVSLRLLRMAPGAEAPSSKVRLRLAAAFSALLFSLHPLRVEVVAWTLGREIAVAGLFFLLTLLCYLRAAENESKGLSPWRWMTAAWILYALCLLGKEVALTLPLALIVLDIYPLRRFGTDKDKWLGPRAARIFLEKLPFAAVALAMGLRAILEKKQSGTLYPMAYGLSPRIAQVLESLAFYPLKTLVPIDLSHLYPLRPFTGFWSVPTVLSSVAVLTITVVLFSSRRRWPAGLAAWVFYVLLLLPVSGIVAFGPYRVSDRFSYLPCAGWAILGGAALLYISQLWTRGRIGARAVLPYSFAGASLLLLAILSWRQTQTWRSSETLWRHALAVDERSSFAHNNLGNVLAGRGDLEGAIGHMRRALEIDPTFVEAHANLAGFLAQEGAFDEAMAHLNRALQIEPDFSGAHTVLGNVLAERGELDQAIEHLRKALDKNPNSAMANYNLARALAKRGDLEPAIAHYRRALEVNPSDPDGYNNLGVLLLKQGNYNGATEQFQNALRVKPNYAKAYFNLGKIAVQRDQLDDATRFFQQALQLEPDVAEIHENLAHVFLKQGKKADAAREYEEALRLLKLRSRKT